MSTPHECRETSLIGLSRGTDEVPGVARAVAGVVLEDASHKGDHEGVPVLLRWPDTSIFAEEMMRRVFWYSPTVQ